MQDDTRSESHSLHALRRPARSRMACAELRDALETPRALAEPGRRVLPAARRGRDPAVDRCLPGADHQAPDVGGIPRGSVEPGAGRTPGDPDADSGLPRERLDAPAAGC